jgi:2,4-dienoyl-CoA reductase-like NADH-dependent reductase (Old Yellow Enzyme family)/thioredoxin reductase
MVFPRLFEPCRIGSLELENRIIMPPCTTNFAQEGFVTDKMVRHYASIARGGVAMIVVEDVIIDSTHGRHAARDLFIDDDRYLSGLKGLADCIKANGARAAVHLNHGGRRAGKVMQGRLALTAGRLPVAPSPLAHFEPGFVVPRELSQEEIVGLIERFAFGARRAVEAGFDAVGIHCSHGYLINQFLSPSCNKRVDEYGGDLEGRMRFLLKVIEGIQCLVGVDFPLFCRISGEEPWEGGLTLQDMKQVARRLEQAGIEAFVLSRGVARYPLDSTSFIPSIAPMRIPRGCMIYLAEGIKEAVSVPVAIANRINDPFLAEEILREGRADLIGICRGLVADPDFPKKAMAGRVKEVRKCIACMECTDKLSKDDPQMVCAVNAEIGRDQPAPLDKVENPKKVLVIGGGPAGMEAARVAATRGHDVHLHSKEAQLGGLLLVACVPPGKGEIRELTDYLRDEIQRLGVKVTTGRMLDDANLERISPDVIILASGGIPIRPSIPGIDSTGVYTAQEVLQGNELPEGKVVVLGGGQVGAEVAEYLAAQGRAVTIVTRRGADQLAQDAVGSIRAFLLLGLKEAGVQVIARCDVREITGSGVMTVRAGVEEFEAADVVVLARGYVPNRDVGIDLSRWRVLRVGDCVEPRNILSAIREGFEAGRQI